MTASRDHQRILDLAHEALQRRDSPLWRMDVEKAAQHHGEACDALWEELERQIVGAESSETSA